MRLYLLLLGLLALVLVLLGIVIALQARHAEAQLRAARAGVSRLRADIVRPDVSQATIEADAAAVSGPARGAARTTDSLPWSVAAHLPVVGHAVASARGTADAVRDLATQVLPDLTQAQSQLRTDRLRMAGGIQVAPLRAAQPLLRNASARTDAILAREQALRADTVVHRVDAARSDLVAQLTSLSGQLSDASDAAGVLPAMLGGSGTRYYFVAFETESESRALGGLPGAFGILEAANGRLHLVQIESDSALNGVTAAGVDLGAAYRAQFTDGPTKIYVNSDVSAHFPDAAQIWLGMWKAKTGQALDGAIVIDPTALGALLDITGPTTLPDGRQLTGGNVVDLTERQAYLEFGADNDARKQFLVDTAKAAADELVADGPAHATQLAHAAARQVGQRRLLVYSAHPDEEAVLAGQPIAGAVPPVSGPRAVTAPYLLVALNNGAGSKTDFWLDRSVDWRAGACTDGNRTSTVTITLHNDAPPGLPTSVTGPGYARDGVPLDTARETVLLYTTAGAGLLDATVDGTQVQTASDTSQGRPVFSFGVQVPRGATTTVVVRLQEPSARGPAQLVAQPLVRPQRSTVAVPAC